MKRQAFAVWTGGLKEGAGILNTESQVLKATPYSFVSRFESGRGTNPEELIAAAHAGCFSMALAGHLNQAGLKPEKIETRAELTLEKVNELWTITAIHLDVQAVVPRASRAAFSEAAAKAEKNCPVSRLLNCKITVSSEPDVAAEHLLLLLRSV